MRDSETRRGEAPQYEAMAASTAARGDALESAPVHPGYTTDSNSYISLIGKDGCVQPHSSLVRRRGQAQGHGRLWMGKRCGASTVYQRPARGSLAHTALWGALTLLVLAPLSSAHQPCPPPPAPSSASATSTAQSQSQGLRGNLIPGPQVTAPAPAPEPLFCETLIQKLSVCPLPATEDSVNVDKYLGRWYTVGASASVAFAPWGNLGSQCVSYNYTGLTWSWGRASMTVVTQDRQVVDSSRQTQVSLLSNSAAAIGLQIRTVCSLLVGVDSVQSLTRAAEVTSVGYVTAPQKQAAEDIRTHVKASSQLSQQIFTLLSLIQNQNNYLNGVAEPRALNLGRVKGLLSVYRRRVEALLRELDTQRQRVVTSAQVMVNATSSPLSQYLLKRVVQKAAGNGPWYAANQGVLVGTRAIRETAAYLGRSPFQSLSSPLTQGPLRDPRDVAAGAPQDLSNLRLRSSNAADVLGGILNAGAQALADAAKFFGVPQGASPAPPSPATTDSTSTNTDPNTNTNRNTFSNSNTNTAGSSGGNPVAVPPGVDTSIQIARQDLFQNGKFLMTSATGRTTPYWIVKLYGDASAGYEAALVYSCAVDASTGMMPQNGLVLLSRAPLVSPALLSTALADAAAKGISLGGDNPFLTVSQNSQICRF